LRQKLKYKDQIENQKMTYGIIVSCGTATTTSHCHFHVARRQLDMCTWQLKKIKKKPENSVTNM